MSKKNPDPRDVRVGQKVRMYRLNAGMSQEALGDALDITFQQIQKYEKGTNRISASRLVAIAKVLKCTPADFFEGVDSNGPSTASLDMHNMTTRARLQIVEHLAEIGDSKFEAVLLNLLRLVAAR